MKKITSRIIFLGISILVFILACSMLFTLEVQGIRYPNLNSNSNNEIVSTISGFNAIFGGNIPILRGYIIKGDFRPVESLTVLTMIRFDYLTFLFLIFGMMSLILVFVFFYKKVKLIFATILFGLSIVGVSFQPSFFWIISGGNKVFEECFSPLAGNGILGVGAIVYVTIMSTILIFLIFRIFYLFLKKVTIEN